MNWKKYILHGVIAGILAAAAGIVYLHIYQQALGTSFNKIIDPASISGACILGCMLMTLSYALLQKFTKGKYIGVLNIAIAVMSFASITGPMAMSLPLDTPAPELFPGLAIPMHFFPALAFFTTIPFFNYHLSRNGL